MLIETKDILRRFCENIEWATSIDLATAWATENDGLYKLCQLKETSDLEIRAIVGLWGNFTHPMALKILDRIGRLRIVDENQHFHPKIYVFRSPKKSVAWVGSANFTKGGFELNEELLLATSDTKTIENWFDRLWHKCDHLQDGAIDEYAKHRKQNQPNPPSLPQGPIPRLPDGPLTLLQGVTDWNGYLDALEQCNRWWASRKGYFVLEETHSWYETISQLHHIVKQQNWSEIDDTDRKHLIGLQGINANWGLLGRMRPLALDAIFQEKHTLNTVQDAVRDVVAADDSDFPDAAIEAYEKITGIKNLAHATATRLLALARPDRIVSFNEKSRNGLVKYFNLNINSGSLKSESYRSLLDSLYKKSWFNGPRPETPRERNIWAMRAALMDCFVYQR